LSGGWAARSVFCVSICTLVLVIASTVST
jgi:hypothetical protein